jgi:hypothetical protein
MAETNATITTTSNNRRFISPAYRQCRVEQAGGGWRKVLGLIGSPKRGFFGE